MFKKKPQYFVVPKNTRIILVSITKESTHKIADAASISFEYVIYAEYNFLLLSGFVLCATKIYNIRPYCPKYSLDFKISASAKLLGNPWT